MADMVTTMRIAATYVMVVTDHSIRLQDGSPVAPHERSTAGGDSRVARACTPKKSRRIDGSYFA